MAFTIGFTMLARPPTDAEWNGVSEAITLAQTEHKDLKNDWELGYWIDFQGGNPSAQGGPTNQDFNSMPDSIIISKEDVDCEVVGEFGLYCIYDC